MQVTREDLNPCTVRLDVVCAPDEVREGFAKAYKQISKHLRVPGFRPGTAPKSIVAQMAPRDEVIRLASDIVVRATIQQAIKQQDLKPHDSPVVELTELEEETEKCAYSAKVPLPPIVELGDYRGLRATRHKLSVEDAEIDHMLDEMRQRQGKREDVTDRGIQPGDFAVVNIKLEGDSGEGRNFMTVAGQTFEALDTAIGDMNVEEMKEVSLTFPDNFQEKDWAGKSRNATVTVRSISTVALPALDDDFAKAIGKEYETLKSETLEGLRDRIRPRMLAAKEELAREMVEEQLVQRLLEASKVHVPDTMWEGVANRRLTDIAQEVQQRGLTMEQYAESRGMTLDKLVENWREQARLHVLRAVVANTIFAREKMVLSNQDITQTLTVMAREYGTDPATLFETMRKAKNTTELQTRAIYRKVMDFLVDAAAITEVEGDANPPPAPAQSATTVKKPANKPNKATE